MGYRIMNLIFCLVVVNWILPLWCGVHGAEETTKRTSHAVVVKDVEITYFAVAGELPITKEGKEQARLFYVAYELQDSPHPNRPITFVFNGGPGAASVWLHLGGLGPVRVNLEPVHPRSPEREKQTRRKNGYDCDRPSGGSDQPLS